MNLIGRKLVSAGLLVGLLTLISGCEPAVGTEVGSIAPDFEVEALQSSNMKTSLKSLRGKVVILDFWATWCGPCKMIAPAIQSLGEKYKEKGLFVMPISNEERSKLQAFETRNPHKSASFVDPFDLARGAFHVNALPTIVVIDRTGRVVYGTGGVTDATPKEIEEAVVKALG